MKISFLFALLKKKQSHADSNHAQRVVHEREQRTQVQMERRNGSERVSRWYSFLKMVSFLRRRRHYARDFVLVFLVTPFFTDLKIHFDIICSSH